MPRGKYERRRRSERNELTAEDVNWKAREEAEQKAVQNAQEDVHDKEGDTMETLVPNAMNVDQLKELLRQREGELNKALVSIDRLEDEVGDLMSKLKAANEKAASFDEAGMKKIISDLDSEIRRLTEENKSIKDSYQELNKMRTEADEKASREKHIADSMCAVAEELTVVIHQLRQ